MIPTAWLYRILAGALAIAALLWLVQSRNHWKAEAGRLNVEVGTIYTATKGASGNQKLARRDTAEQIRLMGADIATLKQSLAVQNAAVAALGRKTTELQAASTKASQIAQERAGAASATSAALDRSSRAGQRQTQPCAPSEALKGMWK